MQVSKSSTPPTTGMKRPRTQSFPGAFEEQLLRLFAGRSAFLRDQLECFGEDATSVSLQLPEGIGSLWLDCVLTPPPDLKKLGDETIAAYLKPIMLQASSFFQDCYMVKKLCRMLGRRLFKAHVEGAGTNSSDQQPATTQHITQVLGQLSSDVVMELLRIAPGSLQEQLPHLPPPLASLAALAHIPSLAAVCSPAPEYADQGASAEHTALTLCVCTTSAREQPAAVASTQEEAADGVAGVSIWVHRDKVTGENIDRGLFTVESRPGVVACRLLARVSSMQGSTISLPDCSCLVLGPGTLQVHGVTFQAQAALSKVAFKNIDDSQSGLGVFVHGVSSRVAVRGGTVAGGVQGVAVQAGGHLEATGLTITAVRAVGAEVQGEGSYLALSNCEIKHSFPEESEEEWDPDDEVSFPAVHVHSRSSALLSSLCVCGEKAFHHEGVRVAGGAGATLDACHLSKFGEGDMERGRPCVLVLDSACRLRSCTLSHSDAGLLVAGETSSAHANKCLFHHNLYGAHAVNGATLSVVSCTSAHNSCGYTAEDANGNLELTDCVSEEDDTGCIACSSAMLRATRVSVTRSTHEGYSVWYGHAVLNECSAKACGGPGVDCYGLGSKAHMQGCTFQNNGERGVVARGGTAADESQVTAEGCYSSGHSIGYFSKAGGQMKVTGGVSEGGQQGCQAARGGRLTMEDVTVDGVLQSVQLGQPKEVERS